MIKVLVLIIVGIFALFTILYAVLGKILPLLGKVGGIFYLVFEWGFWAARKTFNIVKNAVIGTINAYLAIMWISFGIWAAIKIARMARTGIVGLIGSGIIVGLAAAALGLFTLQIFEAKEEVMTYMESAERTIEEMLNPYAYWSYSITTVKTNESLKKILEGIFTAYFIAKEKTPSGKISEIVFVGNTSCEEVIDIINQSFLGTIYKNGFLLLKGCRSPEDKGNYSISVFARSRISKVFGEDDLAEMTCESLPDQLGPIGQLYQMCPSCLIYPGSYLCYFCLLSKISGMTFGTSDCKQTLIALLKRRLYLPGTEVEIEIEEFECFVDVDLRNFIFKENGRSPAKIDYMYCNVVMSMKIGGKTESSNSTILLDDFLTYSKVILPISSNLTYLGISYSKIDDTGYFVIEKVGEYSIIYPKLYYDVKGLSGQTGTQKVLLNQMSIEDVRALTIEIEKIEVE